MSGTVRARMTGGYLELLEKIDIPEGTEVFITIIRTPQSHDHAAFERSAGSWQGLVNGDAMIKQLYEDRARPSDRPAPRIEPDGNSDQ